MDDIGMIDSVIVLLDQLEIKGVSNMKIIFDCVGRLDIVKKNMIERKEGKQIVEIGNR